MSEVGLTGRSHHYPSQLSGGEQQRVAIARAMVTDPALLLADEPTGNLDEKTAHHVFAEMHQLCRSRQIGMLVATHDLGLAKQMDRVITLEFGTIRPNAEAK